MVAIGTMKSPNRYIYRASMVVLVTSQNRLLVAIGTMTSLNRRVIQCGYWFLRAQ